MPETDNLWSVCLLDGAFDNSPAQFSLTARQLEALLTRATAHEGEKSTCSAWMPVLLRPNEQGEIRRAARYVEAVSCLVLDLDQGEPLRRAKSLIEGRRAFLHTSWSHTAEHPKGRIVFPFAEPCPAARWQDVWRAAEQWAKAADLTIDPATKDASRLYYLPAFPAGNVERMRAFWSKAWQGELLTWRELLTKYPKPAHEVRTFAPVLSVNVRGLPGQDRTEQRRRFAQRVVEVRAAELATAGQGGRNQLAFRAGAAAGQLAAAGVLNLAEARAVLVSAAEAAGLPTREAESTINNGIKRGESDGPWTF